MTVPRAPLHAQVPAGQVAPTAPVGFTPPSWLSMRAPEATVRQAGSYRLAGAIIGFAGGAGITAVVLHSGGSTAPCNRSENQDALRPVECVGLIALGGAVGAGIGALIGGAIHRDEGARLDRVGLRAIVPAGRSGWGLAVRWRLGTPSVQHARSRVSPGS